MSFVNTEIVAHVKFVMCELGIENENALITMHSAMAVSGYVNGCEKIHLAIGSDEWARLASKFSGFIVFDGTVQTCLEYRGLRIYPCYGPKRMASKPAGLAICDAPDAVSDLIVYSIAGYYQPNEEERAVALRFAKSKPFGKQIRQSVTYNQPAFDVLYRDFMKED